MSLLHVRRGGVVRSLLRGRTIGLVALAHDIEYRLPAGMFQPPLFERIEPDGFKVALGFRR